MATLNKKVYLVDGLRTPFGKFGGALMDIPPVDLAVLCSRGLIDRNPQVYQQVDNVILGNVVPSTTDTMYGARHLGLKLGLSQATPGHVVNRLCGSGLQIIDEARKNILLGDSELTLVAGTENMSLIPHLVYGSRFGTKYGSLKTVDMLLDALTDQYAKIPMGVTAENLAEEYKISRGACEEFATRSHQLAFKAYQEGYFKSEIVPITLKRGELAMDEHVRQDATIEGMAKLKPSFKEGGTVTPGTASGIVDGAACALIASENFIKKHSLMPLAEIVDFVCIGVDPKVMGIGPVPAIQKLLGKNNFKLQDIKVIEINEAFASQVLACCKALEISPEQVNTKGGAIAIGHPLAASGTRIAITAAKQLKAKGGGYAIASACIGGGQGIAVLLKS